MYEQTLPWQPRGLFSGQERLEEKEQERDSGVRKSFTGNSLILRGCMARYLPATAT